MSSMSAWIPNRCIVRCAIRQTVYSRSNVPKSNGPKKDRLYIGLPYLGKSTDGLRRSIKEICKQFIPSKDVIVYFKSGRRVSNFFRVKDVTPFELRSCVVYEYTCHSRYIGQTGRHIKHRIAEHRGVSHLTGRVMKSESHSSIRDHCLQCTTADCSMSNFKIFATGSSELELLVKESLLIKRRKPVLNGNSGALELLLN